jgi:two-component system, chemotaxis family, CheB/CheR fusion protein
LDFVEKPVRRSDLLANVKCALELSRNLSDLFASRRLAANRVATLTPRQRQIMKLVLAGLPSKNIAADLGVSQRTVETHRSKIMKKTGAKSIPALAQLAFSVGQSGCA